MQVNIRTSELVLDRVLNPTRDSAIGASSGDAIVEACGLIPDFFCQACLNIGVTLNKDKDSDLKVVADSMDSIYQYGGFGEYPWNGTVTTDGVYQSDADPDMNPLALFRYEHMELFVYPYGVCAIRDSQTNECMIARFD